MDRKNKRSAIFLDRDGIIIHDTGYLSNPSKVSLIPDVIEALKKLKNNGFLLVIISNQSGVGRGYFSEADLKFVHKKMLKLLEVNGIYIDGSYYCKHAPWMHCNCRKPNPNMLYKAAEDLGIDMSNSYMVGDKLSDVIAGLNAGCKTILIRKNNDRIEYNEEKPNIIFPNLLSASEWIVNDNNI